MPIGFRGFGALWFLLAAATAVLVALPNVPVAIPSPLLSVVIATTAGAVGLAVFQLGLLRYRVLGRQLDLCVALAFGSLSAGNVCIRIILPLLGREAEIGAGSFNLIVYARLTAILLLLLGLFRPFDVVRPVQRRGRGLLISGATVTALAAGLAAIFVVSDRWPDPVSPAVRGLLASDLPIVDFLPGQAGWVLWIDGALSIVWIAVAIGYTTLAVRRRDPHLRSLALTLTFLSISQLHMVLFPPVALDYVSTSDGLRLIGYLALLFALIQQVAQDMTKRAIQDERLGLARDLHDGLAQQLSLLNLRLGRAADPDRPAAKRADDLAAVRQIVEAALLEVRQSIVGLRGGVASWEEFGRVAERLLGEFAANHDLRVDFALEGTAAPLATDVQMDLLRMLHEALSNAVRHGGATRVGIVLRASPRGLELEIEDDGRGFDTGRLPDHAGLGLKFIGERLERRQGAFSLASEPGRGSRLSIGIPSDGLHLKVL